MKLETGWDGVIMKNILVIDDDIYIGNVLEEVLTKEGYGVFRAYSGTEALFVLSGEKADLVLLDLMLPGLNGEEILPQIKGIPVIVVSAKVDVENNTTEDIEITDNAGNVVGTVGSGSDEQVAVTPVPQPTTTPGTGSGSGGGTTTPSTPAPTPTPKPEEPGETPTPTPGEPEEPGETPTPTPGEPEEPGETPTPTPTPGEPEEPGETPTPTPTPGEPEEPGEVVASITGVTANIVSGSAITTVSGSAVSVTNDMIKTDNGTVRVEPAITGGSIQVQLTFTAKATIDGTEAKDGVTYTWTVDGKTEETESGSYTATVTLSAGTTVAYSVKAAKIADSGTDPAS